MAKRVCMAASGVALLLLAAFLYLLGSNRSWSTLEDVESYLRASQVEQFWVKERQVIREELEENLPVKDKLSRNTLVILYGNMRGGPLAWGSVLYHVLRPLRADLALLTDLNMCDKELLTKAKFRWHVPEVHDWGLYIDFYNKSRDWRNIFCGAKNAELNFNQLGGVVPNCGIGSGALGAVFREEARRQLMGVSDQYEWILFQRSDYLFECDQPPINTLSKDKVYMRKTGGYLISDRGLVVHRSMVERGFNLINFMLQNAQLWKTKYISGGIEDALANYYSAAKIPTDYYISPSGNIKRPIDPTRWDRGKASPELEPFKVVRKYWSDDHLTVKEVCGYDHKTKQQYEELIKYFHDYKLPEGL